jgi:hypothetical protein
MRLLRKHPETFSPGGFVPAAWLLGLLLGPLLCLAFPALWWVYLGVVGFYASVVLATSAWLAFRHRDPRLLALLPAVLATVHAASGWGVLAEWLWPPGTARGSTAVASSATTAG